VVEIRWHGRGGQGLVVASEILAEACFLEGKWAQSFPFFGAERRGAPVQAFTRVSSSPIHIRSMVYNPDIVVVLDPVIYGVIRVSEGLKPGGLIVANSHFSPSELKSEMSLSNCRVATLDAVKIATELGLTVAGLVVPNTAMLGALVKASNLAKLESVVKAIQRRWSGKLLEKNLEAVKRGYDEVKLG